MNASTEKSNPISFTINGRAITATAGTYVLQAARQAGIEIPTLCDHPAVEPVGACRLCMIEVTHPSWNGWSGLMTSCLYPVAEGIQVQTDSPRVRQARRHVLSLLAARCPTSPLIQKLAKQYEALTACLQVNPEADQCILCGLCTRVCESYATAAITTYNRGTTKAVGAFAEQGPAECVGCGACAMICPTQHIKAERSAEGYAIWNKVFQALVCAANEARCIGCGAC
jgi:NADH dehydrogenase/NADH:ubiquinone oxidoreductase subunit G